jgi:Cof subfamily protein (haloacid dehalogenase superfamily)
MTVASPDGARSPRMTSPEIATLPSIKLLVSDVDGTLVRSDKTLSPATIDAFGRLRAAGIQATLISARPPSGMIALAQALEIEGPLGAFNGGTIFRRDGVIESAQRLSSAAVTTALGLLEQAGVDIWVFSHGRWYSRTVDNPRVPHERLAAGIEPTLVGDFAGLDQVDKVVGVSEAFATLETLEGQARAAIGDGATIARSQPYFLDITAPAGNKGDGIGAVAKAAGIPLSQVAAIGDMANDLPMFARAGLAIAMGQAPDTVRAAARFVTASNDEDGVAQAIDRHILPEVVK